MIDTEARLLAEIEDFLRSTDMAETTFGRLAVNDGKFVGRIRAGGQITLGTAAEVRRFIAHRLSQKSGAAA